jgi:hypothetical protein
MAKDPHHRPDFEAENLGGVLSGFLAEEDQFDRRALWRLGSWGAAAVGAVIVAVLANQSSILSQRDQVASADLARQSQQIQVVARESQNEARRLASAVETLNGDRDRLYARVTVLEQGLDSVTGAISRQSSRAAAPPQAIATPPAMTGPQPATQDPAPVPAPAPVASTVATTVAKAAEKPPTTNATVADQGPTTVASVGQGATKPATDTPAMPLMASESMMAPFESAAGSIEAEKPVNTTTAAPPVEVASVPPVETGTPEAAPTKVGVQRTEFAVDVGGANSVSGLRALWRGLLKSRSNAALTTLHPIIVIKEGSNGLGMQLRLVAGPLSDAAAAAKICAGLIENNRPCETTVFDGQRLAMNAEQPLAAANPVAAKPVAAKPVAAKPAAAKPAARRRSFSKRVVVEEPPKQPEPSTLSSFFGRR